MSDTESAYIKVIDRKSANGILSKQTTIDLTPWEMEKKDKTKISGYTCKIMTQKYGQNPKMSFTNIDPSCPEIRKALQEMYAEYDKITKK